MSGITDIIQETGGVSLDFIDLQIIMQDRGTAYVGIGSAKGDDNVAEAIQKALECPLLETTLDNAVNIILNLRGDIRLLDVGGAVSCIQELAGDDVKVAFGVSLDETMQGECEAIIIAIRND